MEASDKLVAELDSLLTSRCENAIEFINKPEFEQCFNDSCGELISVVVSYLNSDILANNKKLFDCCEELINIVADKCPPEEGVLHIIDQIEDLDDVTLTALLIPMQKTVLRIKSQLGLSVDWCFNSIHRHLESLPWPEEEDLEGEETKLLDVHPMVQRIADLYSSVMPFYDPFVDKLINDDSLDEKNKFNLKDAILSSCFRLLGKPMVFMVLEYDGKTKSTLRNISEIIIDIIFRINSDLVSVLELRNLNNILIDIENSKEDFQKDAPPKDNFPVEHKYSCVPLGVYCYLIFSEGVKLDTIPQVYNPLYIFNKNLYLSVMLIKAPSGVAQRKGLLLVKGTLDRLVEFSITESELESPVYRHLIEGLYVVTIYSCRQDNRQLSIKLVKDLLLKFNTTGRYMILVKMVKLANHSGLLGFLAVLYKDVLLDVLSKPSAECEYFTEKRIHFLLNNFCDLPHKAQSDLVELSDQIISCLNLIRFLVIRDTENRTGIKEYIKKLEIGFFRYLLDGINLSRAHYKLKLEDAESERKKRKTVNSGRSTSVTVGKEKVPNLPFSEKIFVINSALNGFDVIESLLCRLNECISLQLKEL